MDVQKFLNPRIGDCFSCCVETYKSTSFTTFNAVYIKNGVRFNCTVIKKRE